jgi:hypothetical protein
VEAETPPVGIAGACAGTGKLCVMPLLRRRLLLFLGTAWLADHSVEGDCGECSRKAPAAAAAAAEASSFVSDTERVAGKHSTLVQGKIVFVASASSAIPATVALVSVSAPAPSALRSLHSLFSIQTPAARSLDSGNADRSATATHRCDREALARTLT